MSYIYAGLALQGMEKEINEANLKKVLGSMNAPMDEAEIQALLALMNHSAPKRVEIGEPSFAPELRRLASQIEVLKARVSALEERMARVEFAEAAEPPAPTLEERVAREVAGPAETELSASAKTEIVSEARYLYCVADGGERTSLGEIGIDGSEVYTIPYRDLCAVVHNCTSEPYESEDNELVKGWVLTHQAVVDAAQERFGTVLPLGFDAIIKGEGDIDPEANMINWLRDDYENLRTKAERLRDKAEYGVQIFWDPRIITDMITQANEEIRKLDEEMRSKPKGTAYMYKQKLEKVLKKEVEAKADEYFRDFYSRIKKHADDVRVDKTKKADEDRQMLMNLSCLVPKDKYVELGEELEGISEMEGFSVRFTGPWPPYSFVAPG